MQWEARIALADDGAPGQRVRAEGRFGTAEVEVRAATHSQESYAVGISARDSLAGQAAGPEASAAQASSSQGAMSAPARTQIAAPRASVDGPNTVPRVGAGGGLPRSADPPGPSAPASDNER